MFCGSCDSDLTESFVELLMEKGSEKDGLSSTYSRYICIGLGLLYLGKS